MNETFPILIILVIITNVLWIWSKTILKRNGFKVSWFWNHNSDIPNLWRLAKKSKDSKLKRTYYLLAVSLPLSIILTFTIFFVLVPKAMIGDPCEFEEKFKQKSWSGIVVKKYIDSTNHNYKVLEIQSEKGNEVIYESVLFEDLNFDKIEPGDSISKEKGKMFAILFKDVGEKILTADYGCN